MDITKIDGFTRVIGEEQGYIGLPLRDISVNDPVTGPDAPAMESAWQPDAADLVTLQAGGQIILRLYGTQHPPVAIYVGNPTDDEVALHNRLAGEIVKSIVKPVLVSGGSMTDVMVLTESVLLGVCLACVRLGGDEKALDIMTANVRRRLAEERLGGIETQGNA